MEYCPPWMMFQIMIEVEAELDRCRNDVVEVYKCGDVISARDLAEKGIAFATKNETLLNPTARNLWAHLHHWRAVTFDDVFKQSNDMDKALTLMYELPDPQLHKMIHFWFRAFLQPAFVAELDKCRHKSEKPAIPLACYMEKLKHLQTSRDREGAGVSQGHVDLLTQCCILAKLLWQQNPVFPTPTAIVQLFEEHAAICVKLKLWDPAKHDIKEVEGYSATPSPKFFHLAAQVELDGRKHQNQEPTLNNYQSALRYIVDGLKVYSEDPDLTEVKEQLDEKIRKLENPSRQRPVPYATVNHRPLAQPAKSAELSSKLLDSEHAIPLSTTKDRASDLPATNESLLNVQPESVKKRKKKKKSPAQIRKRRIKRKIKLVPRKRNQEVKALEEPQQAGKKEMSSAGEKSKAARLPAESPVRVHHGPASGGEKQKKKARRNESKASVALYAELTAQYCITYGCDVCTSIKSHTVVMKTVAHGCSATKLLLQERSDPLLSFILVRSCPQGYTPTENSADLCEHFLNGEECREKSRCPKPHSKVEKMLWDKYFRKKIGFSRFMKDLLDSPLRVRNELGRICLRYNGRYTFICKLCFRKDRTTSKKKSHKPECSSGHQWNENRLLVFERTKGGHEVITLDQEDLSDEAEEIQKCFKELMRCRFTEDEVVDESTALNQRQNALVRNAGRPKKRKRPKRSDDRKRDYDEKERTEEVYHDIELDYDSDLEDVMTVWDSDEEFEEQLIDDQSSEKDPYYRTRSEYQIRDLLSEDPSKYKLCIIHLDGPFAARCEVLEKHPEDKIREIEIRGRMNCGQTLDGDEVVVEVKSTEVLDSTEEKVSTERTMLTMPILLEPDEEDEESRTESHQSREGIRSLKYKREATFEEKDEDSRTKSFQVREGIGSLKHKREARTVTRGVVAGITRKTLNRVAYTFLCRADRYQCHLMKPLDGIAPKIHVKRTDNLNDSVTIYEMQNGHPQYKKRIEIDPLKRDNMLFVVRYLKWDPSSIYPLGYVSHVIHTGETIERSQQVINILHQVPTKPNPGAEEAAGKMDVYIPEDKTWKDLRKLFVVSVDPPNCKDVDDALSVEKINENEFRVGVHIADVSHYVEKDDIIDKNARRRVTSYYAATGKVYGMLPRRLSEDICSLREGEERLVVSVFFRIATQKGVVGKPEICRSVIINRKQLNYEEAETYIDQIGSAGSVKWKANDLECVISNLHIIAVGLRKNRMGDGRFFYESDNPFEMDHPYEAHRMVEEFMILTNRYIGSFLEAKFPGCIPLRLQDAPNEEDLEKWKDSNLLTASRSFYFKQYASLRPEREFAVGLSDGTVSLLMPNLDAIASAAEAGDFKKMKTLIGSEKLHPLHLLAMVSWYYIQEKATYSCSADNQIEAFTCKSIEASSANPTNSDLSRRNSNTVGQKQNDKSREIKIGHFSLQLEHYAQFTSPIRRFLDIVIHRFVKAALDNEPAPYTRDEIQTICQSTNQIAVRSRKYNKACTQLKATVLLQEPFRIPFVVENFDDNSIGLTTPYLPHLRRGQKSITYSALLVGQKPELQNNSLILSWDRRFYDERVSLELARTKEQTKEVLVLDSERHSAKADPSTWDTLQRLVKAIALVKPDPRQLASLQQKIKTLVHVDKVRKQGLSQRLEITSEMKPDVLLVKHHVKFRQTLQRGTVLPIQVGAECLKGYLQPVCQLLQLTGDKDICLQHGRDPVKCFAQLATETVKTCYESAEQYKRVWLPIITMEAATQAAGAGDAILCSNVPIKFLRRNEKYYGTLALPLDFCRKRQIKIYTAEDDEDDSNDYMCIRYRPPHQPGNNASIMQNRVWVAHVVSTTSKIVNKETCGESANREEKSSAKSKRRQMVHLDFTVQHHNGPIPSELLGENPRPCAVEFLAKSLPDRRMEAAVTGIDEASDLCVSIVLKSTIPPDPEIEVPESDNYDIESDAQSVPRNNGSQLKAIKRALRKPFTVIQGPPGTGKTVTGVKLVYWFAKANRRLRDGEVRPQILYCGPSNNAVDVAASLLRKYLGSNNDLKIVRVYSDMDEKKVFPIPRDASQITLQKGRKRDTIENLENRDIALHHLIRKPNRTHSAKLLEYDATFARNRNSPENVSDGEVDTYLKLVTTACVEELPDYDVVFCTCAGSSSKKMRKGTQIRQIIIDECGMCMEPQSQIPLVCHSEARQVVLIGDHKQLQPIVKNGVAKDLGMQKSLFERYQDRAIMLEEQYRMHPSICEFPSREFYDSRLRTASELMSHPWRIPWIWPNRRHPCTVFIHVEGAEKTLSVSTDEGNQQSKSNEAERDEATRIFSKLVNLYHVRQKDVAILSQYKAQCTEIEKNLKNIGFEAPRVSTVVGSQGAEWQYVILSLVRSLPRYEIDRSPSEGWCKRNMGFIIDRHQINVALTRAKIGLIIIGNKHLLRCDAMWRSLLDHYGDRGCIREVNQFIQDFIPDVLQVQRHERRDGLRPV